MKTTRDDEGKSGLAGKGLPGTGGDVARTDDVEGHRMKGGEDQLLRQDGDGGPDGMFRGGPSTQGEIAKFAKG